MEYDIRSAELPDDDDILSLWFEYSNNLSRIDERYEHKEDAGEQWRRYFHDHLVDSPDAAVIVADSASVDGLLGVIEVQVVDAHPIFRLDRHGMVFGHHVDQEYQHNGIEEALLDATEKWFSEEKDLPFYRVNVLAENDYLNDIYDDRGLEVIEHTYEESL